MIPFVDAERLRTLLPTRDAIDALDGAFAGRLPDAPLRSHVDAGPGDLLLMPAVGAEGAGVKLVTVNPGNAGRGLPLIHGVYVLFSPETLQVEAVIDGAALTALRTPAVSGVATRHLAREDVERLVIFGAGAQAHGHLEAMLAVRRIRRVRVVSRTRDRAEALVARARELGAESSVAAPEAVGDADLVCTCTTSREPLFDGHSVAPGAHVNAVGAYEPDARELDDALMRRAQVVVETKAAALDEAGDVLLAIDAGALAASEVIELGEVTRGRRVRRSDGDVTVFKSVGVAFEDLVVARAAMDRAKEAI